MRVLAGIVQQVSGQWALPPVGALVAFIRLDIELAFEDRPQANLLATHNTGCKHGIKQVVKFEAIVAFHAQQVIFSGMESFLYVFVSENRSEQREVTESQWIQQVVSLGGGKLDQAHLLVVSKQAIGFGIDSQDWLGCRGVCQPFKPPWFGDGLAKLRGGEWL